MGYLSGEMGKNMKGTGSMANNMVKPFYQLEMVKKQRQNLKTEKELNGKVINRLKKSENIILNINFS